MPVIGEVVLANFIKRAKTNEEKRHPIEDKSALFTVKKNFDDEIINCNRKENGYRKNL